MKAKGIEYTITLNQHEANLILSALHNARSEMVRIASQCHDMPACRENAFKTYREYQTLIDDFRHETGGEG
jgi:DNA repair exonuclease SbcCD ATPase subunit